MLDLYEILGSNNSALNDEDFVKTWLGSRTRVGISAQYGGGGGRGAQDVGSGTIGVKKCGSGTFTLLWDWLFLLK